MSGHNQDTDRCAGANRITNVRSRSRQSITRRQRQRPRQGGRWPIGRSIANSASRARSPGQAAQTPPLAVGGGGVRRPAPPRRPLDRAGSHAGQHGLGTGHRGRADQQAPQRARRNRRLLRLMDGWAESERRPRVRRRRRAGCRGRLGQHATVIAGRRPRPVQLRRDDDRRRGVHAQAIRRRFDQLRPPAQTSCGNGRASQSTGPIAAE